MNNKYYQSLQTIKTSIDNIENFIGNPKAFELYDSNLLLQAAVERNLEIIDDDPPYLMVLNLVVSMTNFISCI